MYLDMCRPACLGSDVHRHILPYKFSVHSTTPPETSVLDELETTISASTKVTSAEDQETSTSRGTVVL